MNIQEEKIKNIILFFANKAENKKIERLKLIKLIWLSDRLHLNKYGRLILKDKYKALPHGPIASKTLDFTKSALPDFYNVEGFEIIALKDSNIDFFSKSDVKIMDYVWEKFGNKDSFELRNYSHKFPEWKRFEELLNDNFTPNSYEIVIEDFFNIPEDVDFSDLFSKELKELSESDFYVHNSIQNLLS